MPDSSLYQDLLPKSSQYSMLRPTPLDERQNHYRDMDRPGMLAKICHCKTTTKAALVTPFLDVLPALHILGELFYYSSLRVIQLLRPTSRHDCIGAWEVN